MLIRPLARSSFAASLLTALVGLGACSSSGGGTTDGGDGTLPPLASGTATISGASEPGYVNGPRGTARFSNPVNTAVGPDGMVYVADFNNNRIRAVDPETGDAETAVEVAGFRRPFGMLFSGSTLYVTTDDDSKGRHGLMTGSLWRVDVVAGTATLIVEDIGRPRGLAMLPDGHLAMSDYVHHVIESVDVTSGAITILAGTFDQKGMVDAKGAAARFSTPYGMVFTGGHLLVADFDNNLIRSVELDGTVTTVSGSSGGGYADGALGDAKYSKPQGMAITQDGTIFLTDLGNYRVRRIADTTVQTVSGDGTAGWLDSADSLTAQLYGLEGLSVTADGKRVFVADGGRGEMVPYNRIRRISFE